ncbi:hypothetical protein B0H11DRAFT_2402135 [Mycena galericulata]|nr:hypothetical protein B0H11DRAFT_2402135 [Mycena galericulata]
MELGVIDMLLSHLRANNVPASTNILPKWQLDAEFAHLSLAALGEIERFMDGPRYQSQIQAVLDGWPGIFKWCAYIYDVRVASEFAQDRQTYFDSIVKILYILARFKPFIKAMIETAGCLELLTKAWALEDISAVVDTVVAPFPTATLCSIIEYAPVFGKDDMHQRMIKASGGNIDSIVQLLLGRVKKANKVTKSINSDPGTFALSCHIDLVSALCQPHPHPLRRAFYDAGFITILTNSFVALSRIIVQNPTSCSVKMLVSCFNFFSYYLEGNDYLVSPVLADARGNSTLLPLVELATKRQPLLEHIYKLESEGKRATCGYAPCLHVDVKNKFKKCSACKVTYYCSPECQRLAWKASHRVDCKAAKEENEAHRGQGHPKNDIQALHGLAQWEANFNYAAFHDLARKHFPNTPRESLMPCIDFRRVPEEYSVKEIKPGASQHPGVLLLPRDAAAAEARFQILVTEFQDRTLVQSIYVAGGRTNVTVTPMEKRGFWTEENA